MAKHPVFPMWVTDYLADTSHLDATEHGIYHLLLYRYWLTDGRALPDDMAFLRRVTHCRSAAKVRSILEQFWQLSTGEGWHHRRAQREFRVTRERSYMQSERAKKRWKINDDTNAAAYAVAMPPSPSPDPEKERKEKQEKEKKETRARFKKPTAQEVQAYLGERGITEFTGQEFVDSNEAKGWLVGKNRTPMKDWRAAVRTWEQKRKSDKPRRGNGGYGQSWQQSIDTLGAQLGLSPRPGESYEQYGHRVNAAKARAH